MTAKANHSTPAKPVVLFGLDSRGKPKAARFSQEYAGLAIKAASQLSLRVLSGNHPKLADIAARLPVGRVHATGRTFVPFIGRDLYERLVAAADNSNLPQSPAPPHSGTSGGGAGGSRPAKSTPKLPRSWQEIGVGDLVVGQESDPEDGWFDAVVVEANGDMLTLRWRDYPRQRRVVRHRNRLGLLYPNPRSSAPTKQDATVQGLPRGWNEISIGHLVLATAGGPWRTWWEAIPVEQMGDSFKVRWRDYANVAPVTVSRFDLALICPNAA